MNSSTYESYMSIQIIPPSNAESAALTKFRNDILHNQYHLTKHASDAMVSRGVSLQEIIDCVKHGTQSKGTFRDGYIGGLFIDKRQVKELAVVVYNERGDRVSHPIIVTMYRDGDPPVQAIDELLRTGTPIKTALSTQLENVNMGVKMNGSPAALTEEDIEIQIQRLLAQKKELAEGRRAAAIVEAQTGLVLAMEQEQEAHLRVLACRRTLAELGERVTDPEPTPQLKNAGRAGRPCTFKGIKYDTMDAAMKAMGITYRHLRVHPEFAFI